MIDFESVSSMDRDGRTPVFESPYTVVLGLESGDSVPGHTHPGQDILFSVIEGSLALSVGDESRTLEAGDLGRFDGDQEISVTAQADGRAVVVLTDQ